VSFPPAPGDTICRVESEHRDALRRVYQAEQAWRQEQQPSRPFLLLHTGGMQSEIDHPGWDPSWAVPTEQTIDDLGELGLLRVDPSHNKQRTFVLSMKGRETAAALVEQVTMPVAGTPGRPPAPPVVLEWLVAVAEHAPECFQVPARLLDRAVGEGLIDMSGRDALARRILQLLDAGYLSGQVTPALGMRPEQILAGALELELAMKAYAAASPRAARGVAPATSGERLAERDEVRDVFISHASEDKDAIARPLAEALRARGLSVWFDEFELVVGSRLRARIDEGLARSRYGVVIVSHAFMSKPWPQRELAGLVARETDGGEELILPVWHGVRADDVRALSPPLADVLAVDSARGVDAVVEAIATSIDRRRAQDAAAGHTLPAAEVREERTDANGEVEANPRTPRPLEVPSVGAVGAGPWRPRAGGSAFVLRGGGPLVVHLRNVGAPARLERAELATALGRLAGVRQHPEARIETDADVVLRFGDGELNLLQPSEPFVLTLVYREDGREECWEQRIELLRDGAAASGEAKWRAGPERHRHVGGL
jgi:hypothetical protein